MISVAFYSENDKKIWDEFIENSKKGTFMLKRDYMEYHSDRFEDFSLMFYEDDKLIALMPASKHIDEVRSHGGLTYGGMITDSKMKTAKMLLCFEELKNFLNQNNIKTLIYKCIPYIYHKHPSDEDLYALFRNNAVLYRRDIASTVDLDLPIKIPKGRKAQISRAKREGVLISESEDFESFIALENEVLDKRHGAKAVHTAVELRYLCSKFPENIKLYVAEHHGQTIAACLLFVYNNLVHTQYLASNDLSREIGGLDLLIKTLMDQYTGEKKYFDFGISTEENGKVLNSGLISQKEGFGARAIIYDFYKWDI